jgi:hypothetical protein
MVLVEQVENGVLFCFGIGGDWMGVGIHARVPKHFRLQANQITIFGHIAIPAHGQIRNPIISMGLTVTF